MMVVLSGVGRGVPQIALLILMAVAGAVSYPDPIPRTLRSRHDVSNFAASKDNDGYIITEERLRQIRGQFMYWYFDQGGDSNHGDLQTDIHSSTPQIQKDLNFHLPFFGFRFNYTRVSMNGYLEFSDPPEEYTYPLVFPVMGWPKENDPSFIGIFYSKCRIGQKLASDIDQRSPGVYFRAEHDLENRHDQFGVELRERLMWDIREGIIGADTFVPKHAVIATWKNISFAGGIDSAISKTNTFQMVLATDEVNSYVIFNYELIKWTTHTDAGGDTATGEGGVPAFVGFNAGNGTQDFEYTPFSQTVDIRQLTSTGWINGFPGRHIFRIDEKISSGNCDIVWSDNPRPLRFAPESGNMLGGTIVNITGPCFQPTDKIICRFDTESVPGVMVDTHSAICKQPFLMVEGYVTLKVIMNDLDEWRGKYFVETPATATEKIFFPTNEIHMVDPTEIKMEWDSFNLSSNANSPVQISLWGYNDTTNRPQLMYIDTIEAATINSGEYTIVPSNYMNRTNGPQLSDLEFGFLMINLTGSLPSSISPILWSRPIPLAWYFSSQWKQIDGEEWPQKRCDHWIMNDRNLKSFEDSLPQCPCTLKHAVLDKGRYMPDLTCDMDSNPDCFYNRGAIHCVTTGVPSSQGSEQQCCYDIYGNLMLTNNSIWGSKPARSHDLGHLPWNESCKVPTLSQWFNDKSPLHMCCLWQSAEADGCKTLRLERRLSQDCSGYQPPSIATVFGDPHFVTFDGVQYTFNGKGEFVLVRADTIKSKLDVQGRFEQPQENIYGEVRATQLTSVTARENQSAVIEVRLRPAVAQWRYRLDVLADGREVYFDRPALKFQHFKGVRVYTPTNILNQSQVVIMFQSGAGVEVFEYNGYMSVRVYLPGSYMNQTRGLLGNWSSNLLDDFTLPDGQVVNVPMNDLEEIHKGFGIYWLLSDQEEPHKGKSLFQHTPLKTIGFYTNKTFVPEWKSSIDDLYPSNRSHDREIARRICYFSNECMYDYALSRDAKLAHFSKFCQDEFYRIKEIITKRVTSRN